MLFMLLAGMPFVANASTTDEARTGMLEAQGGSFLKGIISGAGSIHMYVNTDTGAFWYYYDKKGPNYKLYLSVSEYDQYTGHLVLVEQDAFGNFTGMFDGYIRSNGVYSGTFTNSRGGKFKFTLK